MTIFPDGRLQGSGNVTGQWSYNPDTGKYTLRWKNGWIDTLSLTEGGNRLDGINNANYKVWGTRLSTKAISPFDEPWNFPEGRACFDEYIRTVESLMNKWNGDQGTYKKWNLSKPYRNQRIRPCGQPRLMVGPCP